MPRARGHAARRMQVLVVDDEEPFRILMESELSRIGLAVRCVKSGEEALHVLAERDVDVILLDLKMPGLGGMETFKRIKESGVAAEVIILTGHPDIDDAIQAMKLGAYDYLIKPTRLSEVEEVLKRADEKKRLRQENVALKVMVAQREGAPLILGEGFAIRSLLETIRRIGPSGANVLIQGETGTGKGLVVRAIHAESHRKARPFLVLNCSAFQEALLESELFGHEKGAFTGAVQAKPGLFEVADGGTLVLDEIAEMSPAMQAKLLQVLDAGELRRVGGTRTITVDVRVLAATNKDLVQEVRAGRFREDLHYRLNVIKLTLPPLKERKEDIPIFIEHFLERFRLAGQPAKAISDEARALLIDYPWPGNVRELANTIEHLVILSPAAVITPDDLPPNIRAPEESRDQEGGSPLPLMEVERRHILKVLEQIQGRKKEAARLLGIHLKTLNRKLKEYGIAR